MTLSRTVVCSLLAAWAAFPGASQEAPKLDYTLSGDILAVARDTTAQNQSRTELGLLDILIHGSLGDRWSTFAEAVFEFEPGRKTPDFNLERFYLQYTVSDAVNLGMGLRRTPLGSWNNAYQNARYFQPAIQRPDVMRSDGADSILPAHDTGLWVNGRNIGPNKIAYDLMLSNGQSATPAGVEARGPEPPEASAAGLGLFPRSLVPVLGQRPQPEGDGLPQGWQLGCGEVLSTGFHEVGFQGLFQVP